MKPVVIIMAAGMGSRYGGLKQMDPVDDKGNVILHYSVFDAMEAGFEDFIFVIKEENEADFRAIITDKLEGKCNCSFAFQKLDDLPFGYMLLADRVKPWGTGHAVRACRELLGGRSFVVINADDYYGKQAFKKMYDYLVQAGEGHYAMVGFRLANTVTENGHVARGVCEVDEKGYLTEINERTHIEKRGSGAAFTEDDGSTWTELAGDTLVSMNFWGFTPEFMQEIDSRFKDFLNTLSGEALVKGEYFLPGVVEQLLNENKCDVQVLSTEDKWYGVTYKEDKPSVVAALKEKRDAGLYDGI